MCILSQDLKSDWDEVTASSEMEAVAMSPHMHTTRAVLTTEFYENVKDKLTLVFLKVLINKKGKHTTNSFKESNITQLPKPAKDT